MPVPTSNALPSASLVSNFSSCKFTIPPITVAVRYKE
jgi:hypothetical protein